MSHQRILRYQVGLMENPGLIISPCNISPATLLPTPEGSLPFHSCRNPGPLDKTPIGTVGRSPNQSWGNLEHWWKQLSLGWKKKNQKCSSLQFWDHRSQTFATRYFSPISWAHSPDSSFRAGKRKKNSHLHWLQVCLPGGTCTCCYLERRGQLTNWGSPINMVIKPLDSWMQSIYLLRFQSPTVKDTKKRAQKWHERTKQLSMAIPLWTRPISSDLRS